MLQIDLAHLQTWVGRETRIEEVISATPARLMAATLDQAEEYKPGDPLPPLWHWLYFHEPATLSGLGPDGHPRRGGFLPPVPLPRRMWAACRLNFARPLRIGDRAVKRSTVQSVTAKEGRSGQLCFVIVQHELTVDGEPRLTEEQTLVYREAPAPDAPTPPPKAAPTEAQWSETIEPGPVLLFRYSALTFNGHRIHYDVDYCRTVEGYPGLVVHGPLIATLLVNRFQRHTPDRPIAEFEFKAVSPLFDTQPFTLHGEQADAQGRAWAANAQGGLAMMAQVRLA